MRQLRQKNAFSYTFQKKLYLYAQTIPKDIESVVSQKKIYDTTHVDKKQLL